MGIRTRNIVRTFSRDSPRPERRVVARRGKKELQRFERINPEIEKTVYTAKQQCNGDDGTGCTYLRHNRKGPKAQCERCDNTGEMSLLLPPGWSEKTKPGYGGDVFYQHRDG